MFCVLHLHFSVAVHFAPSRSMGNALVIQKWVNNFNAYSAQINIWI